VYVQNTRKGLPVRPFDLLVQANPTRTQ